MGGVERPGGEPGAREPNIDTSAPTFRKTLRTELTEAAPAAAEFEPAAAVGPGEPPGPPPEVAGLREPSRDEHFNLATHIQDIFKEHAKDGYRLTVVGAEYKKRSFGELLKGHISWAEYREKPPEGLVMHTPPTADELDNIVRSLTPAGGAAILDAIASTESDPQLAQFMAMEVLTKKIAQSVNDIADEADTVFRVKQQIDGEWQTVEYAITEDIRFAIDTKGGAQHAFVLEAQGEFADRADHILLAQGTKFRSSQKDAVNTLIADTHARGLGASVTNNEETSLDLTLAAWFNGIELDGRKVMVAGHSLGATTAEIIAGYQPEIITKAFCFQGPGMPRRIFNRITENRTKREAAGETVPDVMHFDATSDHARSLGAGKTGGTLFFDLSDRKLDHRGYLFVHSRDYETRHAGSMADILEENKDAAQKNTERYNRRRETLRGELKHGIKYYLLTAGGAALRAWTGRG